MYTLRINNKALAHFIGLNPHLEITPQMMKDYINSGQTGADVKLRRRSLQLFFFKQAMKPVRKKKRIRNRRKLRKDTK